MCLFFCTFVVMNLDFRTYVAHYKALIFLGAPLVVGQIGVILQNFADTLMIGHHSTVELAAASLVSNILVLGILMATGFALCLTPLIGKMFGKHDIEGIGGVVRNGLLVNTFVAALLMMVYGVLYFFLDDLGQPEELLPYVRPYYLINMFSLPFVCWLNGLKQTFDATADTKTPMWILIAGNALNILGNWILIYGHFGFPELGITGAGVSTLFARVVMCLALFLVFGTSRRYNEIRCSLKNSRFTRGQIRQIIHLGTPISLQMGMESGAWSLCSVIVGWIGTEALAGHQIMLTLSQLFFQFYYALASAVSIRVSHFLGQNDFSNIRHTAWAGFHLNIFVAIVVTMPVLYFRECIGWLFTDSTNVVAQVSSAIIPLIVYQFSDGFQCTFSNAMRGLAYVKPVMFVAFVSYFMLSIPMAYFLGIVLHLGLVGVWYSFPFGLTLAGALYYYFYNKRLTVIERPMNEENK